VTGDCGVNMLTYNKKNKKKEKQQKNKKNKKKSFFLSSPL
jgi:hypothetical protein